MKFQIIVVGLLFSTMTGAHAASERFVIDAQYRGIVSRSFPAIGTATVQGLETTPGVMQLSASGRATHPQDAGKQYLTAVGMKVVASGDRVAVLSATSKSATGSELFAGQIQQVLPILAAVRAHPGVATGALRSLATPAGQVQLACRQAGSNVEITAQNGSQLVGKFFLSRQGSGLRLDRFRVPSSEEGVMLNFVAERAGQVASAD